MHDVAIKTLPASVAADPNRMARFQREAQVLAALSHPHIVSIYGLEETDGVRAPPRLIGAFPSLSGGAVCGQMRA